MIMTYTKRFTIVSLNKIVLLVFLIFNGCTSSTLESYLKEIQKENSQIDIKGWDVVKKSTTDVEIYYSLQKKIRDTTYSLSFSYFGNGSERFFTVDDYIKSYTVNDSTYEMALSNNDTLYFFKCNSTFLNNAPGIPVEFSNLNFVKGKYYYMYKRGCLNWGQKDFFENNLDSLIRIRGNDLPELPDFQLHKDNSFTIPEETKKPTK